MKVGTPFDRAALVFAVILITSVAVGIKEVVDIMPLGDSLSICCHACQVSPQILPAAYRHRAEPLAPWEGYIRKLYKVLQRHVYTELQKHGLRAFRFRYVGRVKTCMKNASTDMRVPTNDWDVAYEGHYGYTTKRLLHEVVMPALQTNNPDIVILIIGTNDLIAAPQSTRGGGSARRVTLSNIEQILRILLDGMNHVGESPVKTSFRRHVIVAQIPPIHFSVIGGDRLSKQFAKKGHRTAILNAGVADLVTRLVAEQQTNDHVRRLHLVDLNTNFSVIDHLHGDGLHPNDAGEQLIAERVFNGIAPLISGRYWHNNFELPEPSTESVTDAAQGEGDEGGTDPAVLVAVIVAAVFVVVLGLRHFSRRSRLSMTIVQSATNSAVVR